MRNEDYYTNFQAITSIFEVRIQGKMAGRPAIFRVAYSYGKPAFGVSVGNSTMVIDEDENISLKHYMNVTWVSKPIPEHRPSDEELFGEFYNTETF